MAFKLSSGTVCPAIVLNFWQWVLVVVTIRFVLIDLHSSKK